MKTITELAKKLGVSNTAVRYWMERLEIHPVTIGAGRTVVFDNDQEDLIKKRVIIFQKTNGGMNPTQLSRKYGVSRQTIWNIASGLGLILGNHQKNVFDKEAIAKIEEKLNVNSEKDN
jgi:hypothetical protein